MRFKTKEELGYYLADKAQEVKERLWFVLVEEEGMKDMGEVAKLINLEIEREVHKILEVAEIEGSPEKVGYKGRP